MHELGIVMHVVDILQDAAREHGLSHIEAVTLEVGEVSGVVTEFFQDAWDWCCTKDSLIRDCRLEIRTVPAVTVCNACGKTYATVAHGRICPHCQSPDTELLRGQELNILQIEAE